MGFETPDIDPPGATEVTTYIYWCPVEELPFEGSQRPEICPWCALDLTSDEALESHLNDPV